MNTTQNLIHHGNIFYVLSEIFLSFDATTLLTFGCRKRVFVIIALGATNKIVVGSGAGSAPPPLNKLHK
jgi:hypothetical protein